MPVAWAADTLPIFDAHVHYSQDAWERMPPKEAIALLRKAGVKRALVSSSNDDGNQKLYAEAPDLLRNTMYRIVWQRYFRRPEESGRGACQAFRHAWRGDA